MSIFNWILFAFLLLNAITSSMMAGNMLGAPAKPSRASYAIVAIIYIFLATGIIWLD